MRRLRGRVLVTGGAGFLGSHLVERLLAAGHTVTVLDDLSTGSVDRLPEHERLSVIARSVLDAAALREAARDVSRVFHLAAVVGMRLVVRDGPRAFAVAAEGTSAVLAATGDAPAVLVSSSAVYGLRQRNPARESDPVDPEQVLAYDAGVPGYASGKLRLEALGREAAAAGRPVLVVRPFNVVGEGQSGDYGMVLPTFLARAIAGLPLEVHGDGSQVRSFCEVQAFTDALLALVECPAAWTADAAPVNIGSPEPVTIRELARLVLAETGSRSPIVEVPYARDYPDRVDVAQRVPDVSRLAALVGPLRWPPLHEVVARLARLAVEARAAAATGAPSSPPLPPLPPR